MIYLYSFRISAKRINTSENSFFFFYINRVHYFRAIYTTPIATVNK